MYNTILVPLDGSKFAESALPHAREMARCTGAKIALVRVAAPPLYEYVAAEPLLYQTIQAGNETESSAYLEKVAAGLREEGFKVSAEICSGPIAETILDYAREISADIIVLSTHGRGGLARWFIGSIADKIVRASTLPVLLARPDPAAPALE